MVEEERQGGVDRPGVDQVVVVQDQGEFPLDPGDFVDQVGQHQVRRRGFLGLKPTEDALAEVRHDRLQGTDQYARKRPGSPSPSSNDSQAMGRSDATAHSLTRVVLPKPAGAETRVSLRGKLEFRRSVRRRRWTSRGRGGGMKTLVVRICDDIEAS